MAVGDALALNTIRIQRGAAGKAGAHRVAGSEVRERQVPGVAAMHELDTSLDLRSNDEGEDVGLGSPTHRDAPIFSSTQV